MDRVSSVVTSSKVSINFEPLILKTIKRDRHQYLALIQSDFLL